MKNKKLREKIERYLKERSITKENKRNIKTCTKKLETKIEI